jgi:hypothetical protein
MDTYIIAFCNAQESHDNDNMTIVMMMMMIDVVDDDKFN